MPDTNPETMKAAQETFGGEWEKVTPITQKQFDALHVYFRNLAVALNEAGKNVQNTMKYPIPFTEASVQELLSEDTISLFCKALGSDTAKNLHIYLNDAGYSVQAIVQVPIEWTDTSVKELMAKPFMKILKFPINGGIKTSTKQLSTVEGQLLYESMNAATAERHGVSIPFPSYR
jgi:hypothetical protein